MSRKRTALATVKYSGGNGYILYVADIPTAVEGARCTHYLRISTTWTYDLLRKAARKINKIAKDKYREVQIINTGQNKYTPPSFEISSRED